MPDRGVCVVAITIYDVAQRAGVSITTVSHTLNHPGKVRPATRDKVLRAIDALGFVPQSEASARARKGVGRIGVVAPITAYTSFEVRLRGVIEAIRDTTYELVLYDQQSLAQRADYLSSLPLLNRLDGLVVMSLPFDDRVADRLMTRHLPSVLVEFSRPGFSSITIDDHHGGRLAAEHLLALGHERIAYVGEAKVSSRVEGQATRRVEGIRAALGDSGIEMPAAYLSFGQYGTASARQQTIELLRGRRPPTAIVAHSDIQAVGVLQAAQVRGLSVPEDLAVVGFDNLDIAEYLGLTTVAQPLFDSGRIAVELLFAQLAEPTSPRRDVTLPLELIRRQTT
jgi:LacI family transcriptional regulator